MTTAKNLVILLHGVGSSGTDLMGLAELWRDVLPETVFAAPDAPFPFPVGMGFQWFSVAGVTEDNRAGRIEAVRADFDRVLADVIERNGFSDRLDKVALVGFSQGTIMALDALATGRWPVGAVVGFSGRLATPTPLSPVATPVLLVHGDADGVIASSETLKTAAVLRDHGVDVESHVLPELAHSISAEGAALAGDFLRHHLV